MNRWSAISLESLFNVAFSIGDTDFTADDFVCAIF